MKPRSIKLAVTLAWLALATFNLQLSTACAQGTAFTYQGRLNDNGAPANGRYDLRFIVYDNNVGGSQLGPILTNSATIISNGLFTVTLDFGNQFPGAARWLDIAVRTNGGGNFIPLIPRQAFTPAPYAITAENLSGLTIQPNANDAPNVVGGSSANDVPSGVIGATIAGGGTTNFAGHIYSNSVTANYGTVSGGLGNTAGGGQYATVGGGFANTAGGEDSVVSGGFGNVASGSDATVGGGFNNVASGPDATVPGGAYNVAAGLASLAAGIDAYATNGHSFVWSDGNAIHFHSTSENQFLVHADGGVGIGTNHPAGALHVVSYVSAPQFQITQLNPSDYTRLRMNVGSFPFWEMDVSPGATPALQFWNSTLRMSIDYNGNVSATSFNPSSDRNLKENFSTVSPREVLDQVAALPISHWNFKDDSQTKHIGPMAQDFYAAFGVGPDDKHIATVDADGVALAAIQGLNQKLKEKDAEIQELKQRLDALEKIVLNQKSN